MNKILEAVITRSKTTLSILMMIVLAGIIIGAPVAYFVMQRWLENFAFRIEMGLGNFVVTGALTIVLAVATVSYHSIKASLADPVESIHHV